MKNSEMKSKVATLANRLTPKMGGDQSAAFVKAWAIVKAGGLEIAIKGVTFANRQEALKRLAAYAPDQIKAVLVPEPSNPADSNAIAVLVGVQNGKGLFKLGYVPANLAPAVSAIRGIRALAFPALRVVSGTWGRACKTAYGARLALGI
jgi:hypothetical protein